MASEAGTLLQFVLLQAWMLLENTPDTLKNAYFSMFLTSQEVLKSVAAAACLQFAPGLMDAVQASSPPSIAFFKNLAASLAESVKFWAVYFIIMEKTGSRPRLYIGSATHAERGAKERFQNYDKREWLPTYVQESLNDGFTMTHRGLLCWAPIPSASIVPITRLLFILLEANFTYMFWAMHKNARDVGRTDACPWDSVRFEYDGLCSHCALSERVDGDFHLSPEQLLVKDEQKRQRKGEKAKEHRQELLDENSVEYLAVEKSRRDKCKDKKMADDPDYYARSTRDKRAKNKADKTFHCQTCDASFGDKHAYDRHMASSSHEMMAKGTFKYYCEYCKVPFSGRDSYVTHQKRDSHLSRVKAAGPDPSSNITQYVVSAAQQTGTGPKETGSLPAFKLPSQKNTGSPTDLPPAKKPKLAVPAGVQTGTSQKTGSRTDLPSPKKPKTGSGSLPGFKLPVKKQASVKKNQATIKDFFVASGKKESGGDY